MNVPFNKIIFLKQTVLKVFTILAIQLNKNRSDILLYYKKYSKLQFQNVHFCIRNNEKTIEINFIGNEMRYYILKLSQE